MSATLGFLEGVLAIALALAFLFVVASVGSSFKRYLREVGWFYEIPWSRWVREMRQGSGTPTDPPDSKDP